VWDPRRDDNRLVPESELAVPTDIVEQVLTDLEDSIRTRTP
jgi:hypothetical protein